MRRLVLVLAACLGWTLLARARRSQRAFADTTGPDELAPLSPYPDGA